MNILLLVGSGDTQSHSLALGQAIERHLQALGAETDLINLATYELPMHNRTLQRANAHSARAKAFLRKSYAADAYVWVTPIYHNSYSGVLKSALDWQYDKLPGKVVGLASHGGNRSPQAVDQLMLIARAQGLVSGRVRVSTQDEDYDNFELASESILSRVADFAEEIVTLTRQLS